MTDGGKSREIFKKYRGLIYAIVLALVLANFDGAVINIIIPRIIVDLGGGHGAPWLASSYLLGAAVSIVFWGPMGDAKGHQRILIVGLWLLFISTTLCAFAGLSTPGAFGIYAFSLCRLLQGIGAGAILTAAYTLSALMLPVKRRARNMGAFNLIFAVLSLIGPSAGGVISDHSSINILHVNYEGWRMIFLFQVPIIALSIYLANRRFLSVKPRTLESFDYVGGALIGAIAIFAVFCLYQIQSMRDWGGAGLLAGSVFALVALTAWFVRNEKASRSPIFPPECFSKPEARCAVIASFFTTGALLCFSVSIVAVYQLGLAMTTGMSGGLMSIFAVGVALGSIASGRMIGSEIDCKVLALGSILICLVGLFLMSYFWSPHTISMPVLLVLTGIGFGPLQSVFFMLIQYHSPQEVLGASTSVAQIVRRFGAFAGSFVGGCSAALLLHDNSPLPSHVILYAALPTVALLSAALLASAVMPRSIMREEASRVGVANASL